MQARSSRLISSLTCLAFLLTLAGTGCKPAPKRQVAVVDGVEVIVNPSRPIHKDPGRVLKIQEKLRIRDTGEGFYFKYPERPEIGPDGSIFLMDEGQLLRFSPDGAFLGNLIRLGQGPGEIQSLNRYLIEGREVYAADGAAIKVVRMTLEGRALEDRRLDDFETLTRKWIIGSLVDLPKVRGVLADAHYKFICTSRADEKVRKTYDFPGRFFIQPPVFMRWDYLAWVPDPRRDLLFVSLSRDYGIKVLDLDRGRVVRSFSRVYPKVPFVVPENMKAVYARGGQPRPDFERDVLELFLPGDSLWVRTSTVDPQKGQLFDVFNAEGDFLDSFFVPVKDTILGVCGDTIFAKETAGDGTIAIALYRNMEYPAASAR